MQRRVIAAWSLALFLGTCLGTGLGIEFGPQIRLLYWTRILVSNPDPWAKLDASGHLSSTDAGMATLWKYAWSGNDVTKNICISQLGQIEKPSVAVNLFALPGISTRDKLEVLKAMDYPSEHRRVVDSLRCQLLIDRSAPVRRSISDTLKAISSGELQSEQKFRRIKRRYALKKANSGP